MQSVPPVARRPFLSKPRRAFTLIEILAVAAIIAILAVLIVPVTSTVQARAESGKCLSNLRQIGIALNLYANEHNGLYPASWAGAEGTWVEATVPYIGQDAATKKAVWVCPDAKLPMVDNPGTAWVFTYSINGRLSSADGDPTDPYYTPQLRRFGVDHSTELILVADATQNPDNNNLPDLALWNPNWAWWGDIEAKDLDLPVGGQYANTMGNLSYHHPGHTANAVMVDGSARGIKEGDLKLRNIMARTK